MDKEKLYSRLPVPLQNLICSAEGYRLHRWRYDREFFALHEANRQNVYLAPDALAALQNRRLGAHIQAAASSVYWKGKLEDPGDAPLAAIASLPLLAKAVVKENVAAIANHTAPGTRLARTSGTTGSGLVFPVTRAAEQEQWSVWWRYRSWHGIDHNSWCGYFSGRQVVPTAQATPPYWRCNRPGRQLMFSGYHLSESSVATYVDALNRLRPPWLHGYPSILALLARLISDSSLRLTYAPRLITIGAESLHGHQRQVIEQVFRCPVRQHYGMAEGVANISECERGSLHVDEDYALVEFLPTDLGPTTFRIVGTNWSNPAFPLFRYDTGDLATLDGKICDCGRNGRTVTAIEGRMEDYISLPNGVRLGRLGSIFRNIVDVKEAQLYQPDREHLVIRVVRGKAFSAATERAILHEAKKRIGDQLKIELAYLDEIGKTRSGKLKFVVSDVDVR
jgi:phenylacetate-CoA ligase